MECVRCGAVFCWCCMKDYRGGEHNKWYRVCPNLPFSYCVNLIINLLFIIFLPVILILGSLGVILCWTLCIIPFHWSIRKPGGKCRFVVCWLICILILTPLAIAIGMPIAAILSAIAILPLYFLSIAFFVHLCIIGCKTKL